MIEHIKALRFKVKNQDQFSESFYDIKMIEKTAF